jgi:cyclase
MVLSIQAKRNGSGSWEALYDNGREHSGLDAVEWAKKGEKLGAGELLVTSVDNDGLMAGMDLELVRAMSSAVNIPIIACGGVRDARDIIEAEKLGVSGVAVGSVLHYKKTSVMELKADIVKEGGNVRIK